MKVKLIEKNYESSLYEIHDGDKWWTANHDAIRDEWYIVNERLQVVREDGRLGLKIVDACKRAMEEQK